MNRYAFSADIEGEDNDELADELARISDLVRQGFRYGQTNAITPTIGWTLHPVDA